MCCNARVAHGWNRQEGADDGWFSFRKKACVVAGHSAEPSNMGWQQQGAALEGGLEAQRRALRKPTHWHQQKKTSAGWGGGKVRGEEEEPQVGATGKGASSFSRGMNSQCGGAGGNPVTMPNRLAAGESKTNECTNAPVAAAQALRHLPGSGCPVQGAGFAARKCRPWAHACPYVWQQQGQGSKHR